MRGTEDEAEDDATGELKKMIDKIELMNYKDENDFLREDTLQYIAGYLMFATKCDNNTNLEGDDLLEEEPICDRENDIELRYLDLVNEGGLIKPSDDLVSKVEQLENIFRSTPITSNDIYKTLMDKATEIEMNCDMKKRYFKTRINARIRYLNKKIVAYNYNKKTKTQKKYKKITTYETVLILRAFFSGIYEFTTSSRVRVA